LLAGTPTDNWGAHGGAPEEEQAMTRKTYTRPSLKRLGLLRQLTQFSF
jgi:hypothetical protein